MFLTRPPETVSPVTLPRGSRVIRASKAERIQLAVAWMRRKSPSIPMIRQGPAFTSGPSTVSSAALPAATIVQRASTSSLT